LQSTNTGTSLDEVAGVDAARSRVTSVSDREFEFTIRAPTTGPQYNDLGHDGGERSAPASKTLDDAIVIKSGLPLAYAATTTRQALIAFVIVRVGATGVE